MKAAQLVAHGVPGKFELSEIDRPISGAGEVLVEVFACGLNRLDLWLEEGGLPIKVALPVTPGGEIAGRITEVGKGVQEWKAGDAVAIQSNIFCGECEFCRRGEESLCLF